MPLQIQLLLQGLAQKSSLQGSFYCVHSVPIRYYSFLYIFSSLCPDWKIFEARDCVIHFGSSSAPRLHCCLLLIFEALLLVCWAERPTPWCGWVLPFHIPLSRFPTPVRSQEQVLVLTQLPGRGHCFRQGFFSFFSNELNHF